MTTNQFAFSKLHKDWARFVIIQRYVESDLEWSGTIKCKYDFYLTWGQNKVPDRVKLQHWVSQNMYCDAF